MYTRKALRSSMAFAMILALSTNPISIKAYALNDKVDVNSNAKAKVSAEQVLATKEKTKSKEKSIAEIRSQISSKTDISSPSGISKSDFIYALEHCKYDKNGVLGNNAELIWDECQKHSLNEWCFCGFIAAESGWCTSPLAVNNHNITSIRKSGSYAYFDSYADCIKYTANLLDEYYIKPGSTYNTGGILIDIGYTYAGKNTAKDWAELVSDCAYMCTEAL